jgi:hypothetical protein
MIRHKLLAILAISLGIFGCNYVKEPFPPAQPVADCPVPAFDSAAGTPQKNVLFEEFTGHQCGNCPGSTLFANTTLKNQFGDRMIIVSIHAGTLAEPEPPGTGKFETDFRTTQGDAYNTSFGVTVVPIALIDRSDNSGLYPYYRPQWQNAIDQQLNKPLEVNLKLKLVYDNNTQKLCAFTEAEFLTNKSGNFNTCIYIVEDSIIDWQKNYAGTGDPNYPTGDVSNYVHKHVFRTTIGNTWGLQTASGNILAGDKFVNTFAFDFTGKNWNKNKIHIVAYIYDDATKEVLQTVEKRLIE